MKSLVFLLPKMIPRMASEIDLYSILTEFKIKKYISAEEFILTFKNGVNELMGSSGDGQMALQINSETVHSC